MSFAALTSAPFRISISRTSLCPEVEENEAKRPLSHHVLQMFGDDGTMVATSQ